MKNRLQWFGRHKVITAILVVIIIIVASTSSSTPKSSDTNTADTTNATTVSTSDQTQKSAPVAQTPAPAKPAASAPARQVKGTAVTLGAGTFTGGKDVAVGLYDVTGGAGQSGNFMVSGTDSYNEILGEDSSLGGVPKVRTKISNGDQIQISGLSSVTFTPVTAAYLTTHTTTDLYAGTFIVGQDIGAGRYLATPGSGQSGNFMVDGTDSYNEILGGDSTYGRVPSVSVTLTNGDVISISGLSQVTLTAK